MSINGSAISATQQQEEVASLHSRLSNYEEMLDNPDDALRTLLGQAIPEPKAMAQTLLTNHFTEPIVKGSSEEQIARPKSASSPSSPQRPQYRALMERRTPPQSSTSAVNSSPTRRRVMASPEVKRRSPMALSASTMPTAPTALQYQQLQEQLAQLQNGQGQSPPMTISQLEQVPASQLQKDAMLLATENEQFRVQLSTLLVTVEELRAELIASQQREEAASHRHSHVYSEVSSRLSWTEEKLQQAESQLKDAKGRRKELRQNSNLLSTSLHSVNARLGIETERVVKLQQALEREVTSKQTLQTTIDGLNARVAALEESLRLKTNEAKAFAQKLVEQGQTLYAFSRTSLIKDIQHQAELPGLDGWEQMQSVLMDKDKALQAAIHARETDAAARSVINAELAAATQALQAVEKRSASDMEAMKRRLNHAEQELAASRRRVNMLEGKSRMEPAQARPKSPVLERPRSPRQASNQELIASHQREIAMLRSEHKAALDKLEMEHRATHAQQTSAFEAALAALKAKFSETPKQRDKRLREEEQHAGAFGVVMPTLLKESRERESVLRQRLMDITRQFEQREGACLDMQRRWQAGAVVARNVVHDLNALLKMVEGVAKKVALAKGSKPRSEVETTARRDIETSIIAILAKLHNSGLLQTKDGDDIPFKSLKTSLSAAVSSPPSLPHTSATPYATTTPTPPRENAAAAAATTPSTTARSTSHTRSPTRSPLPATPSGRSALDSTSAPAVTPPARGSPGFSRPKSAPAHGKRGARMLDTTPLLSKTASSGVASEEMLSLRHSLHHYEEQSQELWALLQVHKSTTLTRVLKSSERCVWSEVKLARLSELQPALHPKCEATAKIVANGTKFDSAELSMVREVLEIACTVTQELSRVLHSSEEVESRQRSEVDALETAIASQTENLRQSIRSLERQQSDRETLQAQVDANRARVAELEEQVALCRKEAAAHQTKAAVLEQRVELREVELVEERRSRTHLDNVVHSQAEELMARHSSPVPLANDAPRSTRVGALEADLRVRDQQVSALESDLRSKTERIELLSKQMQANEEQLSDEVSAREHLSTLLLETRSAQVAAEAEVERQRRLVATLEERLARWEKMSATLQSPESNSPGDGRATSNTMPPGAMNTTRPCSPGQHKEASPHTRSANTSKPSSSSSDKKPSPNTCGNTKASPSQHKKPSPTTSGATTPTGASVGRAEGQRRTTASVSGLHEDDDDDARQHLASIDGQRSGAAEI